MLRRTVVVVLACWGFGLAAQGQPAGATRPFLGVTLTERTLTSPRPARMLVAQVDPNAPGIRVTVSPPGGAWRRVSPCSHGRARQTPAP